MGACRHCQRQLRHSEGAGVHRCRSLYTSREDYSCAILVNASTTRSHNRTSQHCVNTLTCGVVSCALLCVTSAFASTPPSIDIPRIDSPPTLADFEEMRPSPHVADHMVKISGFIAREPSDGAKPTQDTDVYLAYDQKNLYAAFVCWDAEPEKIRARMDRREDILSDDSAEIMI